MPSVVWWGWGMVRDDSVGLVEGEEPAKKRTPKLTQKDHRFLGTRLAVRQELVAQAGSSRGGAHVVGFGTMG